MAYTNRLALITATALSLGLAAGVQAQSPQSPNAREARESRESRGQTPMQRSVDESRHRDRADRDRRDRDRVERERERHRPPQAGLRPDVPHPDLGRPGRPHDPGRWEQRRPDDDPPPGWRGPGRSDWLGDGRPGRDRDRDDRPGWRGDHRYRPSPPIVWHRPVPSLPPHARVYHHRGDRYWYGGGRWYRPYGGSYVVVRPPVGLWISTLPSAYRIVHYGPSTYYYADEVYYSPVTTGGYQVVEPPEAPAAYEPPIAYPAAGQSPQQQANDEYECHVWAMQQSGYDPSAAAVGQIDAGDAVLRGNYTRAYTACLEGRGYTVR